MSTHTEQFDTARLNAISITEVARRLGDNLRKVGANHITLCPWHEDHHPSLSMVTGTGKNYCHCFSCGKGGDVISYTMQRGGWSFQDACKWLSSEFGIGPLNSTIPILKPKTRYEPPKPTYTYIPMPMLDELVSTENSLCQCLMRLFPAEAVEWVTEEYRIGCYAMNGHDDYTVFPNIDFNGQLCNLKIQHYETDPTSALFAHSEKGACFWLGAIWAREGRLPTDAHFRTNCLFGEHLLPRYPADKVALVESPKNVLYGTLFCPHLTWVATGNKQMLKREVLQPLQGRDVIVIPDADAVDEWSDIVRDMADIANFTVSDFCRRCAPRDQPKFDIADYLQQQLWAPPF